MKIWIESFACVTIAEKLEKATAEASESILHSIDKSYRLFTYKYGCVRFDFVANKYGGATWHAL